MKKLTALVAMVVVLLVASNALALGGPAFETAQKHFVKLAEMYVSSADPEAIGAATVTYMSKLSKRDLAYLNEFCNMMKEAATSFDVKLMAITFGTLSAAVYNAK